MVHSNPSRIAATRAAAVLLGLALAALPASAVRPGPSVESKGEAGRHFDLRTTLPAADAPSLRPEQQRAIEALRDALPDLRVGIDPVLGTTRNLSNAVGFLTGPRRGDVEVVALDFALGELDLLGLDASDLADYEVTDSVYSEASGVTHLYLRQRLDGIPVYNGQLHFNIASDGRVLSVNNLFVPGLRAAVNSSRPALAADAAAAAALAHAERETGAVASATSEPSLMYLPIRSGEVRLVWNLQVETADSNHWYDINVDAVDARVWTRIDWVADAQYRVYPVPAEAPTFVTPLPPADGRITVIDPQNATASPFGWHDTNGVPGAETLLTSGNNVNACIDRSPADNVCDAGSQPSGGASLVFTPAIDLTQAPTAYQPAAVVNLYYWNNIIHDVAYLYGFDEQGGNFQENNYGNGGAGSDSVNADAQDGAGSNNANFSTPPDGSNPRMQMFLWNLGNPNRDGDLDSGIVAHEYGHGISNRLVGGPGNVGCLSSYQQPGEGLSDWWSLFYTFEGATPAVRGIGTYALFQPTNGAGIRSQRYDKTPEPNSNTWTYESLIGLSQVHAIGEKWGQAYWYVQGRLEDEHGFDPDIYNFTGGTGDAGNIRAMFYIIEGLKNSACSPSFTDVRDGIIAAAASSYGGADVCTLWQAFADYGLGVNANDGNGSNSGVQNDFTVPGACSLVGAPPSAQVCAGSDFVGDVSVGSAFTPPVTMSASGVPTPATSSFSPNPVASVPSLTTLTISNTGGVAPGTYPITVTGSGGGGPGSDVFDLTVIANPGAPELLTPVNSTNTSTSPSFSWTPAGAAIEYRIEVDDNADFSSPVIDEVVNGTTYAPSIVLVEDTLYYWRVSVPNCAATTSAVFRFATSAPSSYCRNPSLAIPDNSPGGVNDNLVITDSGTISDLDVSLAVTHTWVGDLAFTLSNGGTPVAFYDRPGRTTSGFGCSGDDIDVVVNDEGPDGDVESQCDNLPATSGNRVGGDPASTTLLAAFDGAPLNGTWTLNASDNAGGDTGTVTEWCLLVPDSMPFLDGFETNDTTRWSSANP